TRLTVQGTSIHVNSEGEVVHGFSEKASAPLAAAELQGLMSFSDGSPSASNTPIRIKSLDDFQNFDQFRAFLKALDSGGLHFSDGIAAVEVVYRQGNYETLLIHKEFLFSPVARGKALQTRARDRLRIVVQERGTSGCYARGPLTGAVFTVLEDVNYRHSALDINQNKQKLRVSEVHQILAHTPNRFTSFPTTGLNRATFRKRHGHAVKRVEMVRSIDYGAYEGYVSSLEDMILDTPIDNQSDLFVDFVQSLFADPSDPSNPKTTYYLPPVIYTKMTSGNVTPTVLYYLTNFGSDWVGLFPYGQYATLGLKAINQAVNQKFNLNSSVQYTSSGSMDPFFHYGESLVSQVINRHNNVFTPTPDQAGNIRKGLVQQVGLQVEQGYLQRRGDRISVALSLRTIPDDLSELMEYFTEEQQAMLLDKDTGLKMLPYTIHTDYSMVIGGKVHYFNNTDRGGAS
ncbi:hypothetical protein, partial [Tindallia californiensis]